MCNPGSEGLKRWVEADCLPRFDIDGKGNRMTTHNNSMANLASKEHGSDFLFFCGMATVQVSTHHSQDATPGTCGRIILAALTRATTIHTMGYSY